MMRTVSRSVTAGLFGAVGLLATVVAPAYGKSPIIFTPDGTAILVSKEVNGERWTVTLDAQRASVTGNVYEGDRVVFLWCGIVDTEGDAGDLAKQTLVLHCFIGNPCTDLAECRSGFDQWQSIGEVRIAGSFFLP